ncbi:hypothetical protein ACFVYT_22830 [Streptomyces sp. NPDC058290]|uniref:hypothetical protein n=1 Tax=Streptomyces sp. NPDC058290 TaxID=3346426 RepID=UPI0036E95E70
MAPRARRRPRPGVGTAAEGLLRRVRDDIRYTGHFGRGPGQRLVADWAEWAAAAAEQWPDEPRDAVADREELAETVRRAAWSEADAPG